MDDMYSQFKSFMNEHPGVKSISIKYNYEINGVILSMRYFHKDSGQMAGVSKAIYHKDLSHLSENEYRALMLILAIMYDECLHME